MGIVSGLPRAALPQLDTSASPAQAGDVLGVLARHARTLLRADQVWIFVCATEDCSADQLILASVAPDPDQRERQARAAASNAVSGRSSRFDRASAPSCETAALPISLDGRAVGAIVAIWSAADPAALDGDETLAELAQLCAPILGARLRPEPRPERPDARGPSGYGAALPEAIKAFDRLPALEDSKARVMAALSSEHPSIGEAVAVIETDPGLTAAVLRAANAEQPSGRKRIASVPAAVDALGSGSLFALVSRWPTFRPFSSESLPLHSLSTHLNATRLASDAIARAIDFEARHQLRAIALLHDIGKLVLARAWNAYPRRLNGSVATPEERLALERRMLGLDHASVGALVIERWGLPRGIARIVARHHAEDAQEPAVLIRLADMLAHHSHGHPVSEEALIRAATAVGLDRAALRRILFELPRAPSGRLADPSPLTPMQAKVLRLLAEAKKYKVIAAELGLSESTIRSHAHALFATMGVPDRAQAVLLASERGWI